MLDMVRGDVVPSCVNYQSDLSKLLMQKKACGEYNADMEEQLLSEISKLSSCLMKKLKILEGAVLESKEERDVFAQASFYRNKIFAAMSELRVIVDELETLVARNHWPFPSYAKLLYSVI